MNEGQTFNVLQRSLIALCVLRFPLVGTHFFYSLPNKNGKKQYKGLTLTKGVQQNE